MKVLQVKIKSKGLREDCSYKNEVNPYDAKMLAIILNDLETMFNVPVRKAFQLMQKDFYF